MKSAWKSDSVLYYVSSFLSFTHILPWMEAMNLTSYLVIVYLCIFLLGCIVAAFLYVAFRVSRPKGAFVFPQQILRQAFFGLSYVLFIPFLGKRL